VSPSARAGKRLGPALRATQKGNLAESTGSHTGIMAPPDTSTQFFAGVQLFEALDRSWST
jgi:hypothetical protein